jgi:hypothetical protein
MKSRLSCFPASLEPVPDTAPAEPTITVLSKIAAPSKACRSAVALALVPCAAVSGRFFSSGHSPGKKRRKDTDVPMLQSARRSANADKALALKSWKDSP